MRVVAIAVALSACASLVDVLDGEIDDQQNCCAALTEDRIRRCLVKFEGPGWCWEAECKPPIGHVEAFLHEDGEITACPESGP